MNSAPAALKEFFSYIPYLKILGRKFFVTFVNFVVQ